MRRTFGLRALLLLVGVMAVACALFSRATTTIRCDFGPGVAKWRAPGKVMDVYAKSPEGEYEIIATDMVLASKGTWGFENGSNVCYVDLDTYLIQKWQITGYHNYRLGFPLHRKANLSLSDVGIE